MKKSTFGFTVETREDSINITSSLDEDHGIVISPHEVDGLVAILKEAKKEVLQERRMQNQNNRITS